MTTTATTATTSPSAGEAERRRAFAIISHPDAGKTTLTEKFLLYAGAVTEAGAVRARRNRRAVVSDWMEMERTRGISISSTVLRFTYRDTVLNLLDTPGHADFSEDTYRVLAAADSVVMVLDAARGVESQTRKLFDVCRRRQLPVLTFVNKYDRPGQAPLQVLDEIESVLGIQAAPATWPVGAAEDFRGVLDRRDDVFVRFDRTPGGAKAAPEELVDIATAAGAEGAAWSSAREETDLLDAVGADVDVKAFLSGEATPVFFGSAVTNFGVRLLLDAVVDLAPPPAPRVDTDGTPRPLDAPFAGFVFKVQANMDPRHRDRVAFVRVVSGQFERGMTVTCARTGKPFAIKHAHEVLGRDRAVLDDAYPGDVLGVVNAAGLLVGDTLYADRPVMLPPIEVLAPEHFVIARNRDTSRYKQFRRGLVQLDEEGVVHVLRGSETGDQAPVLAAVGPMQFEVAGHRLAEEFGAPTELRPAPYHVARLTDADGAAVLRATRYVDVLSRANGDRYALFANRTDVDHFTREHPDVTLAEFVTS